jgi:hypothetical protein
MGDSYIYIDFASDLLSIDSICDAIEMVQLDIGGRRIDSYSGDAMRIFANGAFKIEIHGYSLARAG